MLKGIQLGVALTLAVLFDVQTTCHAAGETPYRFEDVCIYHPEPAWWALGRGGMHGKVVCQLIIDPKNGEVTEVKVLHKTRFSQLNAACVLTAFKWKFKPHTITQVTVPFELVLRGYAKEIH